MNYLKSYFDHMFNSQGRISRNDFWMTMLWVILFSFGVNIILGIVSSMIGKVVKLPTLMYIVVTTISVIMLFSTISMQIRRLHDTGKSTLFIFFNLIPIIGQFIVIYFYCLPGDVNANDYGYPESVN
ncbi:MAG: DUF805 domain-containing protein [Erysipelothrix sp.]